jgi:capsular exopolysaccharide synthesis family protein
MDISKTAIEEGSGRLREYLVFLRARIGLLVIVIAVVVAAATVYSLRQTPMYEAGAEVLVKPLDVGLQTQPVAPNLETERKLVTSDPVARIAAEVLSISASPKDLLPGLFVGVAPGTEILEISYTDADPQKAQQVAQAFADSYLEHRREDTLDQILSVSRTIEQRIDGRNQELRGIEERISQLNHPGSIRATDLQIRADSLRTQKAILEQELIDSSPPQDLNVGQIVLPASVPTSPSSPNHVKNILLGLMAGIVLGLALAVLRERLDDRLRGRDDMEMATGAPLLAAGPRVSGWKKRDKPQLVTLDEPNSSPAEAYRKLRAGVLFTAAQRGAKVLMVTSPHEEEGKTATTSNLGVALAQAGKKVVLISADLRKPRLHRFFSLENYIGVTSVLAGDVSPWQALRPTDVDHLQVLTSGPIPHYPAELLGSDAMGRLLASLREVADIVLLDCPPVLAVADTVTLAPLADAVLFVADAQTTHRSAVEQTKRQLDQVNAQILGCLLNNFDPVKAAGYYYGASYRYEEPKPEEEQPSWLRRKVASRG